MIKHTQPHLPTNEEKPKIDCSGVKVGITLSHKVFGNGKVITIDSVLMTVSFGGAEKKFQYPDALQNGFFKLDD